MSVDNHALKRLRLEHSMNQTIETKETNPVMSSDLRVLGVHMQQINPL